MIERSTLKVCLENEKIVHQMGLIYGNDEKTLESQRKRYLHLSDLFAAQFPQHSRIRMFSTSGRTEVAGNHTDHQRGHVLCASVDLDILAMASPNAENIIRIKSKEYDKVDVIDLAVLTPQKTEIQHSAALIRGIATGFKARGLHIG